MTHSSGIVATNELKNAISQASKGTLRLMKMTISSESLILEKTIKPSKSWQSDFDNSILPCLTPNQPCYLLYRLDSRHFDGSPEWLLTTYVPESTPTRHKMIYASTKMTMKKTISSLHVKHEISATLPQECSLDGFEQYLRSLSAPKPLTQAERELEMIRQNEEEMRNQGRKEMLKPLSFPITPELQEALEAFRSRRNNYVQMAIDMTKEAITLTSTDTIDIDKLKDVIPIDKPRYSLYSLVQPDRTLSTVFIHSIPVGKSTIKEKMLYSSCKAPLLQHVHSQMGITIARKLETDSPEELTREYMLESLAPPPSLQNPRNFVDQRHGLPSRR